MLATEGGPQAAKAAGLRYTTDTIPGIRRVKRGRHFAYIAPDGKPITDKDELARIAALAIPPAYSDVWICPILNGHLQATGRDARGRKQYRYHARWRETRDETKYDRMVAFAQALPKIRKRVDADLKLPGMPREKVLATVVQLLESTSIRVGNDEYARDNGSFGLTTLQNKHVKVQGSTVRFSFKGKSGIKHAIDLNDRRIAKIVRSCQDLPGHQLFEYVDDDGSAHPVDSSDVNAYIQDIAAEAFTAKDFRTWVGTVNCAMVLAQTETAETAAERKQRVTDAIKEVAQRLGNTPTVCRKCYVHPEIISAYTDSGALKIVTTVKARAGLLSEERFVVTLLRKRAKEGVGGTTVRQLKRSLRERKSQAA